VEVGAVRKSAVPTPPPTIMVAKPIVERRPIVLYES
jgi:hypothetical protein